MEKFYITTAIYYLNDKPHIGSVSEAIAADVIARYKRLRGFDVFFSTGTDEHAQKIEERARREGIDPQEFVDKASSVWKNIFDDFGISYSRFIRTSDKDHIEVVKHFFQKLYEKGDIYLGTYEGWYCVRDATFLKDSELVDGKCPICGGPVQKIKEDNYFFKLSKYQQKLSKYYEEHKNFMQPPYRYNEVKNVIESGLQDVSVSRKSFKFGVPVPFDEKHTIYVWFDALLNYLTAVGFLHDEAMFNKYWPADLHLIGKDITRFHGIVWPAMLMSYGLPLPKAIFAHGFWNLEGQKMSKSTGNVVNPSEFAKDFSRFANISEKVSTDVLRYYLTREVTFGQDGNFKMETYLSRYNSDLANDFGNLLNRTVSMLYKYFNGEIPDGEMDPEAKGFIENKKNEYFNEMDNYTLSYGLEHLWNIVGYLNNYIQIKKPWTLKTDRENLAKVMYTLLEGIKVTTVLLSPIMPFVTNIILKSLGETELNLEWNTLKKNYKVEKLPPIFPRIEKEKITLTIKGEEKNEEEKEMIEYEDFAKLDLRVAKIIAAERVPKSRKLIKLTISLGDEERTIVGGIALHYNPDELVGKKIIVIKNLKPRKLMGITSQGMLLAATNENEFSLLTLDRDVKEGSKIS